MLFLAELDSLRGATPRATPRITAVAHDRQQPRAPIFPAKSREVPPRPEICLLHGVLRIVFVAQDVTRQRVGRVEQRHDRSLETIARAVRGEMLHWSGRLHHGGDSTRSSIIPGLETH